MTEDDAPRPRRKPRAGRPVGETLGGILAGFDQQVLRQQPPAQELVLKGSPVRGLSGDDPGDLEIVLPGLPVPAVAVGSTPEAEDSVGGEDDGAGEPKDRPA